MFSLFCEYIQLEDVHIHVISVRVCRVNQAKYVIDSCGCATGIGEYLFNT